MCETFDAIAKADDECELEQSVMRVQWTEISSAM